MAPPDPPEYPGPTVNLAAAVRHVEGRDGFRRRVLAAADAAEEQRAAGIPLVEVLGDLIAEIRRAG